MACNAPAPLSSPLWAVQQLKNVGVGGGSNAENSISTVTTRKRFEDNFFDDSSSSTKSTANKFVCQLCGSHQNSSPTKKSAFSFGSGLRGSSNVASRRQLSACPACDQKVCASCRHEAAAMPAMRDFAVEVLAASNSSTSKALHHNSASLQQQHSRERRICKAIMAKKWICWACAKQLQLRLTTGFGGWLSDNQQQQQQTPPNGSVSRHYSFSSSSSFTTQTLPPPLPPATTSAHRKPTDTINNNNILLSSVKQSSSAAAAAVAAPKTDASDASSTLPTDGSTFFRRQPQLSVRSSSSGSSSSNQALQKQSQQVAAASNTTTQLAQSTSFSPPQQQQQQLQQPLTTTTLTKSKRKSEESDKTNMPPLIACDGQLRSSNLLLSTTRELLEKPDYDSKPTSSELQQHSTHSSFTSSESQLNRNNSLRFRANRRQQQQQQQQQQQHLPQQRDPSPFRHVADGRGNLASPGFSRRAHYAEQILLDSASNPMKLPTNSPVFHKNRQKLSTSSSLARFIDQTNELKKGIEEQKQQQNSLSNPTSISLSQQAMNKLTSAQHLVSSSSSPQSQSQLPPPAVPNRRRLNEQQQANQIADRAPPPLPAKTSITNNNTITTTSEVDKISYFSSSSASLASTSLSNGNKKSNSSENQRTTPKSNFNSNQMLPENTSFALSVDSNSLYDAPQVERPAAYLASNLTSSLSSLIVQSVPEAHEKRRSNKKFTNKLLKHFAQSSSLEETNDNNNAMTLMSSVSNHHPRKSLFLLPSNDEQQYENSGKSQAMTLDRAFLALRARSKQPAPAAPSVLPPVASVVQHQPISNNVKIQPNMLHAFFNSLTRNSGGKDDRTRCKVNDFENNLDGAPEFQLPQPPLQANRFASLPRLPKKTGAQAAQPRSRAPLVLSTEGVCAAAAAPTIPLRKPTARQPNGILQYRDAISQDYTAFVQTWQEIEQIQAEWFDAEVRMEDAEREFGRVEREFDEFLRPQTGDASSVRSSGSQHSEDYFLRNKRQFKLSNSNSMLEESQLPRPELPTITYESDCMVTVTVPAVKSNYQNAKYKTYNPRTQDKSTFYMAAPVGARSDDDETTVSVDGRKNSANRASNIDSYISSSITPFNRSAPTSRSTSNSTKSASPTLPVAPSAAPHVCRIVVEDTITPTLRLSRQSSLCHTSSSSAASPSASASSVFSTSPRSSAREKNEAKKFNFASAATSQLLKNHSSSLVGNRDGDAKTTITISSRSSETEEVQKSPAVKKTVSASNSSTEESVPKSSTLEQEEQAQRKQHAADMVARILRGEQPTFSTSTLPRKTNATSNSSGSNATLTLNASQRSNISTESAETSLPLRRDAAENVVVERNSSPSSSRVTHLRAAASNSSHSSLSSATIDIEPDIQFENVTVEAENDDSTQQNRQLSSSPPSKPGGDDFDEKDAELQVAGSGTNSATDERVPIKIDDEAEFSDDCSLSSSSSSTYSPSMLDVEPPAEENSSDVAAETNKFDRKNSLDQLFAPKTPQPETSKKQLFSAITSADDLPSVNQEIILLSDHPVNDSVPADDFAEHNEDTDFFDEDEEQQSVLGESISHQKQPVIPPRQCRKVQLLPDADEQRDGSEDQHGVVDPADEDATAAMLYAAMRLTHNDLHRLLTPIPEEDDFENDDNEDPFCDVNLSQTKFDDSSSAVASDDETIIDEDEQSNTKYSTMTKRQIFDDKIDSSSFIDNEDLESEYSAVGSDFEDDENDDEELTMHKRTAQNRRRFSAQESIGSDNVSGSMSSLELYFLADLQGK